MKEDNNRYIVYIGTNYKRLFEDQREAKFYASENHGVVWDKEESIEIYNFTNKDDI